MSITPRPPIPSFLPETAPFSPEQRTWLNGLFAGLFRSDGRRHAAVGAGSRAACARRRTRHRPSKLTTARPGTIRRCRSPIA